MRRADHEPALRLPARALFRIRHARPACCSREFGNPEIEHLHVSIRAQHDVFGFDVAMQDPAFVCGRQGRADLDSDVQRIAQV